jgi:hypothetical protein
VAWRVAAQADVDAVTTTMTTIILILPPDISWRGELAAPP